MKINLTLSIKFFFLFMVAKSSFENNILNILKNDIPFESRCSSEE